MQRSELGSEFLQAVDSALEFIAVFPQTGSPIPEHSHEEPARRVAVRRFPFHIVYLEHLNANRVLACAHDWRLPRYRQSRVTN